MSNVNLLIEQIDVQADFHFIHIFSFNSSIQRGPFIVLNLVYFKIQTITEDLFNEP